MLDNLWAVVATTQSSRRPTENRNTEHHRLHHQRPALGRDRLTVSIGDLRAVMASLTTVNLHRGGHQQMQQAPSPSSPS